jgi:hypothetical protein
MTTQVPAVSAITFGQASHSSVRRIGPSTSAFFARAGRGRSSSSTGISATPRSDISAPRARIWFRGALLPSTAVGDSTCAGRKGGLLDCAGRGPACPRHLSAKRAPAAPSRGIQAARTNVWAGIALVRRHPQGNSAMRKNILLAICVGALALPLAACSDPQETATVAQTLAPRHPAAAGTFVDPDGRYRQRQPLARWRQARGRRRHGRERLRHRAGPSAHGLRAAERRRAGRREQRAAEA